MYQVYSITTPDNKYRYYGTTKNVATRMYLHNSRFKGNEGSKSEYYVYRMLRENVDSFYDCKLKVIDTFKSKKSALKLEQSLIEKNGNLNTNNAVA
jgi:predicted GIY-YIG superfamily endonuclease